MVSAWHLQDDYKKPGRKENRGRKSKHNGTHKVCATCKVLKPFAEYNKDRSRKSGIEPRCKECNKARLRARPYKKHERTNEALINLKLMSISKLVQEINLLRLKQV